MNINKYINKLNRMGWKLYRMIVFDEQQKNMYFRNGAETVVLFCSGSKFKAGGIIDVATGIKP